MKKIQLQKLTLAAIALFLTVSCSKDDAPAPAANLPKVTIGNQIWQSSNLDVTTYRDGTVIPQVTDATAWKNLSTGAWCYYENNTANGTTYGKLYNWYALAGIHDNDPNTPNKVLAPTGWHVPTDAEWSILINFLGGESVAGGKMKATGTSLWTTPNTDATNSSGFGGLPGGFRFYHGASLSIGSLGLWWSSTVLQNDGVATRSLFNTDGGCYYDASPKTGGLSVRCLKD